MTSSAKDLPGDAQSADAAAALLASLHLMPSPLPNPDIKHTQVGSPVPTPSLVTPLGAWRGFS